MVQKKICQDSFKFQNEDTSSMANNKPPTGAPNADATPAPAPAEMKLRLRKEILVIRSNITGKDVRKHFLLRWGLNVYNRGVFFTTIKMVNPNSHEYHNELLAYLLDF